MVFCGWAVSACLTYQRGKHVELTLAAVYFQFFIVGECVILLRPSRVNLNKKKEKKKKPKPTNQKKTQNPEPQTQHQIQKAINLK